MVIAIDGPAGSGKSTVARELAKKIHYRYVDSGAMYRAVTLKALQEKIDMNDEAELSRLFHDMELSQTFEDGKVRVFNQGEEVTEQIRSPEVSAAVSIAAAQSSIRYHVTALLHVWGSGGNIVIEGRDIGTYVFPDADHKFFIDASPRVRAERRFGELKEKGYTGTIEDVEKDIIKRDELDKSRELAPLKIAKDAEVIDTSTMTIEQVVNHIAQRMGK